MSQKGFQKILLVVPKYSSFYKPYVNAFKYLGISYKLFDNRRTNLIEKIVFVLSLIYKPLSNIGNQLINDRLLRVVKKYKPDLVLVIKGENISDQTVNKIKQKTKIVNYFPDYFRWFKEDQIERWLQAYEYIFTGDLFDVDTYKKKGYKNIGYVHLAGPEFLDIQKIRTYDVVFVGTYSKEREEAFKFLDNLDFKIWGNKKWIQSSLSAHYQNKWLSADETMEVFRNSKIVINFHNDLTGKNRYINLRVFEATAAGSLLISDLRKDLSTVFKIGREIIIFKNPEDLALKVKYYLANEAERLKIASLGYQRCKQDHNYIKRLEQMFNLIPQ